MKYIISKGDYIYKILYILTLYTILTDSIFSVKINSITLLGTKEIRSRIYQEYQVYARMRICIFCMCDYRCARECVEDNYVQVYIRRIYTQYMIDKYVHNLLWTYYRATLIRVCECNERVLGYAHIFARVYAIIPAQFLRDLYAKRQKNRGLTGKSIHVTMCLRSRAKPKGGEDIGLES